MLPWREVFWVLTCLICKFSNLHQGKNRWHSYHVLNTLVCFKPCINPPFGGLVMVMYLDLWGVLGHLRSKTKKNVNHTPPKFHSEFTPEKWCFEGRDDPASYWGPVHVTNFMGLFSLNFAGKILLRISRISRGSPVPTLMERGSGSSKGWMFGTTEAFPPTQPNFQPPRNPFAAKRKHPPAPSPHSSVVATPEVSKFTPQRWKFPER